MLFIDWDTKAERSEGDRLLIIVNHFVEKSKFVMCPSFFSNVIHPVSIDSKLNLKILIWWFKQP